MVRSATESVQMHIAKLGVDMVGEKDAAMLHEFDSGEFPWAGGLHRLAAEDNNNTII